MTSPESRDVDVVVVGAGFSGLAAALELIEAGLSVQVLEARDRVGGRVETHDLGNGAWVDLGGTWAGPVQDRILAMAERFGVGLFEQYATGKNVVDLNGRLRAYSGTIPRVGIGPLLDMGRLQWKVGRAAKKVDPARPWEAKRAAELDAITLADWLARNRFGDVATRLLAIAGRTVWGAEPREMSMLYVLQYITSSGGLDALLDTEGGGQHWRFEGGASRVALAMAGSLPEGSLQLRHEVSGISTDAHGVTVTANSSAGEVEVRAGHAIVALPPALRKTINFSPSIADSAIAAGWKMANLTKCFAVYDEPFWRAQGMTGEALTDAAPGGLTFDVSPPDASCGVLVGFAGGDDARTLEGMSEAAGREAVLKGFARLYGDKALKPEAWITRAWKQEQWSGGGPVAFAPPGAITATRDSLRAPAGRIHWAGTETSPSCGGFIDGAIRAGERAAAEISGQ
jgi:monoamine oxidase